MIDLHSHILPGIDDGAPDLATALDMARMAVDSGVRVMACSPHILPGVYHNSGPDIRRGAAALQVELDRRHIPLRLVPAADVHMVPDMAAGLREGRLLSIADTRYVLVEPPHTVAPQRMDDFFFNLQVAGFVAVLTHPERLGWIDTHYASIERLADNGVLMQITSASLAGRFGRRPRYWAERMLGEARVHILASDAHDTHHRPPDLDRGYRAAVHYVGDEEARRLVLDRPVAILEDAPPGALPAHAIAPPAHGTPEGGHERRSSTRMDPDGSLGAGVRRIAGLMRQMFNG